LLCRVGESSQYDTTEHDSCAAHQNTHKPTHRPGQSINQSINQSSISQSVSQPVSQLVSLTNLVAYMRRKAFRGQSTGDALRKTVSGPLSCNGEVPFTDVRTPYRWNDQVMT